MIDHWHAQSVLFKIKNQNYTPKAGVTISTYPASYCGQNIFQARAIIRNVSKYKV